MNELRPEAFPILLPLLQHVSANHLFARSVLEREVDGRVWVDREERPTLAHVVHPYGMTLLLAADGVDIDATMLKSHLDDFRRQPSDHWMQVSPHIPVAMLDQALDAADPATTVADGTRALRYVRANFRFDPIRYAERRARLRPLVDCRLRSMGPADFALSDIGVSPHKFWRDAEQFLSRGGGWCIEHAGGVVAMAFTSFRFGAQLEIGIETRAAYRGQGLAVHAACALLDQCVTLGLEPVWSCRKENQGSYNLAKSLGFQPTIEAPYYHLPAANAAQ